MAGTGAGATSALIMGGFLCLGLFLLGIAITIILSLIPIYTQNHSEEGYGAEFAFDALMLKLLYDNGTVTFADGTVANSSELSRLFYEQYAALGASRVRGGILYNGRLYAPHAVIDNTRRRRRATQATGYHITQGSLFLSSSCGTGGDKNKTENSTKLSSCIKQALILCNAIITSIDTTNSRHWTGLTSQLILEAEATDRTYHQVPVNNIYGVNAGAAAIVASNLTNVTASTISSLQRGCRYVGPISIAAIDARLASVTASNTTTDYTTQPTG